MKNSLYILYAIAFIFTFCSKVPEKETIESKGTEKSRKSENGLKDYYRNYFQMGVAVAPRSLQGEQADLILNHFSSLTAENVMKMGPIHPELNKYDWEGADRIVAFADENNLKVRGHTLCWHNQTPTWLFIDDNGNDVSKEVLLARLKAHIFAVAGRYKGKIYAWDVVNEAVSDGEETFYREDSPWYRICGEEYIARAFEYAHEADPDALLFYNDYNTTKPAKRDKIIRLIKDLQEKGIPVHGMGMQGHWSVFGPDEQTLRESMEAYKTLGLQIQITELDVSIYKPEGNRRDRRTDESDEFTSELEQKQQEAYEMFFKVFRDYKDDITGITFWNVSDRRSWLDNFPVRGRKNYPLLFDEQLQPKKAYWKVVEF